MNRADDILDNISSRKGAGEAFVLATVALVVATTILLKMGRLKWIWVTLGPMVWLFAVTMTASFQKVFSSNPRLGFLSYANLLTGQIASGKIAAAKLALDCVSRTGW